MARKKNQVDEPRGSIGSLFQSKHKAASSKSYQALLDATEPHEKNLRKLWAQHSQDLSTFTSTRFDIGGEVAHILKAVRDARYPGGFKKYHADRGIPVPRPTCLRYAALYQDVACLGLRDDVLNAAFAAGVDLIRHAGKIKTAKTEVQGMTGPQFVAFLQHKPTPTQRQKLITVPDYVDAGMVALAVIFEGIEDDEKRNQAYAGVAFQISRLSQEAAFTGGEFTVKSPLATDELEDLFRVERKV